MCFVGEPAIDTGGSTREFWHLLNNEFQEKYCLGSEGKKVFDHNVPALEVMKCLHSELGDDILHVCLCLFQPMHSQCGISSFIDRIMTLSTWAPSL